MTELNDTTRSYPRTLNEAFPNTAEYANTIEHYSRDGGSGLFEMILLFIGLGLLSLAVSVFL